VRGAIIFFLGVLSASCGAAPRPKPESRAQPEPSPTLLPVPRAQVTGCVATPSTVYGDEVVAFDLEGEGTAQVELFDQRRHSVFRGRSPLPGRLPVPDLPSGDFTLIIGESKVSCAVTVNRELPRASSAGR
jgi:hypothetical protein